MAYFMEDGSTTDWSETFSSLRLSKVVVPSVSNITELNLSNSQMRTEDITKVLTDEMLADQCRLMTAIMAEGWGRPSSKPMDTSKVAKTPMAKHVDVRHDDPDEEISAKVTEETMENNSKMWTALIPTKPNRTAATTEPKLNSNSTRGPTQDLLQDKTSTKSWHKTNTELALDKVQTETDEPDNDKEATGTDTVRKDVTSDEPDHNTPKADEGAFAATIREVDKPSNEPLTIMSGFEKPTTKPHIIDVEDDDNSEEETDELITTMGEFKIPPARPHIIDVEDADTSEEETDEPGQITTMPDEWFEVEDALQAPPRA
jgi:hypothetical protein